MKEIVYSIYSNASEEQYLYDNVVGRCQMSVKSFVRPMSDDREEFCPADVRCVCRVVLEAHPCALDAVAMPFRFWGFGVRTPRSLLIICTHSLIISYSTAVYDI